MFSFGLGVVSASGMPPLNLWPVMLLGLAIHIASLTDEKTADPFRQGFWFQTGFLGASLHWVVTALGTDWSRFWWLAPVAVLGLPAFLALPGAVAAWSVRRVKERFGDPEKPCLAAWQTAFVLTLFGWIRGHWPWGGFPWALYGSCWKHSGLMAQTASSGGIYGLEFLTLLLCALCAQIRGFRHSGLFRVKNLRCLVLVLFLGSGGAGYGLWHTGRPAPDPDPPVRIRLVQPAVPQTLKQDPQQAMQNMRVLVQLSRSGEAGIPPPALVIWPETAVPWSADIQRNQCPWSAWMKGTASRIVTGLAEFQDTQSGRVFYNSLVLLDDTGAVLERYHKHRLLPFGEFVPGKDLLPLPSVAHEWADYRPGPGPVVLGTRMGSIPPFIPLVCSEAIFPESCFGSHEAGSATLQPRWLLNITNDTWFEGSWGPRQHMALAAMRAVEQGMPLVRVANSGISAVTDCYGRIRHTLAPGIPGTLDAELPGACTPTPFRRLGFAATTMMILGLGCLCRLVDTAARRPPFLRLWGRG